MSERQFFSLRYTLPGYTFVLMAIFVVAPQLQILFPEPKDIELVVVFLGFLLSGNPIGFLISQIWYIWFKSKLMWFRCICFRKFLFGKGASIQEEKRKKIRKKFDLKEDKDREIMFLDYITTFPNRDNSKTQLLNYTQRRFDLVHIFGSTLVCLVFGFLFGYLIRLYFHIVNGIAFVLNFWIYDFPVIIIAMILLALLILSLHNIYTEHALVSELLTWQVMNSNSFPPEKARKEFSAQYFKVIEVINDEQLKSLNGTRGFLINADYPTKDVKIHCVNCKFCNPSNLQGVKPSSKKSSSTGEFWYSVYYDETLRKAEEISKTRKYNITFCKNCLPHCVHT